MEVMSFWEAVGSFFIFVVVYWIYRFVKVGFYNVFYLKTKYEKLSGLKIDLDNKKRELSEILEEVDLELNYYESSQGIEKQLKFRKIHLLKISQLLDSSSNSLITNINSLFENVECKYQEVIEAKSIFDELDSKIRKIEDKAWS